jgi:hypothetical protein
MELARRTSATVDDVLVAMRELAGAHVLVLSEDGDAVRMAHPFSVVPTTFVVTPVDGFDNRRWWGSCAWGSVGISAALKLTVRIDTACPDCGAPIRAASGPHVKPGADLRVWFPAPARTWWDDIIDTCSSVRMFCGPDHVKRWIARTGREEGAAVPAATVWSLAQGWYGDRLADDFVPLTREQGQQLLNDVGLTGSFWRLP